jgi:DNA polymerase (family 10)
MRKRSGTKAARGTSRTKTARAHGGGGAGARGPANAEFARIFREVAELLELSSANPFRVRAYVNAARVLEESPVSVAHMAREQPAQLRELPGIGEDLAAKVEEIARTGSLAFLQELSRQAPPGAVALMHVPGIGPRKARLLSERLGVRSVAGLARAARAGRVRALPGFGARSEQRLLAELAHAAPDERRMLRARAAQYAEPLLEWMRGATGIGRVELAGSFRRCRETVGDLDLLVENEDGRAAVRHFTAYPQVARILARGTTRAAVQLAGGLHVDLRVLPAESYGAALHYFTGSKAHNIAVRGMGRARGLKISEYGVFRGARRTGGRTEAEVFAAVGLPFIPPELREDRGEIDAARRGQLPSLVTLADIRGDLQSHSTDSDGRHSMEAMAEAAEALGYEYLALTDHTPSVRVAGGLDRAGFRAQMRRIDRLNARLKRLTLLKGAEVDIHPDGSLDLDDDTLERLDVVLVSLHASLGLPPQQQTARLVRALRHARVHILAHPTGRLVNGRRGAQFDLDEVCRVAANEGVFLEVNAQPERLDLDDIAVRRALELGCTLVISTDAHATEELGFMRWGVDQARRGWTGAAHVANTRPLAQLLKGFDAKR